MAQYRFLALSALLLSSGCATTASPAAIGHVAGIVGAMLVPGAGQAISMASTLVGLAADMSKEKKLEAEERQVLNNQLAGTSGSRRSGMSLASATPGEPTRVWVDEQFVDGRSVAGYFEERAVP